MSALKTAALSDSTQLLSRPGSRFFGGMLLLVLAAGAVSAALLLLYFFNPAQSGFYPLCLFNCATGLLCPGCGSLRAMHQLLHGNVIAALRCNVLLVGSLPLLGLLGVRYAYLRRLNKPTALAVRPVWFYAAAAALLVFSVLRNLPSEHFSLLRP